MRALGCGLLVWFSACGALTPPAQFDAGAPVDAGSMVDAGQPVDAGTLSGTIDVQQLYSNRSRLGARSAVGFRAWRGGLAIIDDWLYWAESGTAPGLYRAPVAGCAGGTCVEKVAAMVRPSVFSATTDSVLVADVTVLKRFFPDGRTQAVATASEEIMNLSTDGAAAFWTTERNPVLKTPFGGSTTTLINSNGTPVSMTVAGERTYWAGVDISGSLGALQSIRVTGSGAREESRFGSGFETMRGSNLYLYYARDNPAQILRLTLNSGFLEVVATNCQRVNDFAIDATHAYWVEPGTPPDFANGRVRRVAHESTSAETLAQAVPRPVAIAVKDGVVFVASAGSPGASYGDGSILRITVAP